MKHQEADDRVSFSLASQIILLAFLSGAASIAIAQVVHERAIKHDITILDYSPAMQEKIRAQRRIAEENARTASNRDENTSTKSDGARNSHKGKKKIDYVIVTDRVITKRWPGSDDITGVLRKGSKVNIYEENGAWVQVSPNKNRQWIERSAIVEYK